MTKTITLSILEALDYLYANNLTIDKLWPVDVPWTRKSVRRRETHITTKPRPKAIEPDRANQKLQTDD